MPGNNNFSNAKDPPPWLPNSTRASSAPSTSVYSDDFDDPLSRLDHPDMPHIPPLRVSKSQVGKPNHVPAHIHHGHQHIQDSGPHLRQSRLPIFRQVRSMLQKPSPVVISEAIEHNDGSYQSGNNGDAYERTDGPLRRPSPTRIQKNCPRNLRSDSPASVLGDQQDMQYERLPSFDWNRVPVSAVSSISDVSSDDSQIPFGPSQVSVNVRAVPQTPGQTKMVSVKRKPTPSGYSQASENVPPPPSPPYDNHYTTLNSWRPQAQPNSHFSWTTDAPSIRPTSRPPMDTSNPTPRHSKDHGETYPTSRFSWSTVQTGMTHTMRPESPPPSPPPAVPSKYRQPPVQSILSRHRPIQRADKEVWTPPPRKTSLADHEGYTDTPTSARSKLTINPRPFTEHDNAGSGKKLPPPPELGSPALSHKEVLLKEEQDKIHQRRNIERAISDLITIETASPMDVSWEQVKDARSRIAELKTTLAEVQMEEREIGVAITRARRKEGEEEGLWVRRVTS